MSSLDDDDDRTGSAGEPGATAGPAVRVLRNLRERDQWLAAIAADRNLTDFAARVATALSRHFNFERDDPAAWPSVPFLAAGSAGTERGVQKALTALIAAGYLVRDLGGRGTGKTSRYSPTLPNGKGEPLFGVKSDPTLNGRSPYEGATPNGGSPKNSGSRVNHGSPEGEPPCTQTSKEEGQAPMQGLAHTSDDHLRAPVPALVDGSAPPPVVGADFSAFLAAFPTKTAPWTDRQIEAASVAFRAAVDAGADPLAVIEGARHYATKRAAEVAAEGAGTIKFTSQPAVWLTRRDWEKSRRGRGAFKTVRQAPSPRPRQELSDEECDRIIAQMPVEQLQGMSTVEARQMLRRARKLFAGT